jgi:hypothetical protein
VKQFPSFPVAKQTGTAEMQFIIDLIWNHSRSSYLVAMSGREAGQ